MQTTIGDGLRALMVCHSGVHRCVINEGGQLHERAAEKTPLLHMTTRLSSDKAEMVDLNYRKEESGFASFCKALTVS